jgi:hypothetical protein
MIDRKKLINLVQRSIDEISSDYDCLALDVPEYLESISGFIRRSIVFWKSKLKTGDAFRHSCIGSSVSEYIQSAGAIYDEILTDENRPQHWLPVSNGCCKFNVRSLIESDSDHLSLVCEVRDGYASILVSPEGYKNWEFRKIDSESTFNLSYGNNILEVLSGQLDLSVDYIRSKGHFYSNCPGLFRDVSIHIDLPLAIPYDPLNQNAIYLDLSWNNLDVFLPLREGFLHRRLPSFGLKNQLINNDFLHKLQDKTIKSVLLRGRHRFEETSGLKLNPNDLSESLTAYSDHVFHMFRACQTMIHLSGWFGSPLIQKQISNPTIKTNKLQLPPKGCLSTWHNVLCIS